MKELDDARARLRAGTLVIREESADMFVLFDASHQRYVFCNESFARLIRGSGPPEEVDADYLRVALQQIEKGSSDVDFNEGRVTSGLPAMWSMTGALSADRCQTFGMPL